MRAGFVNAFIIVVLAAICVAVPIEARKQRDAAREIGDVELYHKTMGELNRLLRQQPQMDNVPLTRQSHLTYFSGKACASWWDGMVMAGMDGYAPVAPDNVMPAGLFVQEPFRGSIRGIHLGDTCYEAARRLGVPASVANAPHGPGLRDFPGTGVSWLEGSDHRIKVLVVANCP